MRKIGIVAAVAFSLACLIPASTALAAAGENRGIGTHRVGLGVNYWKTIDNLGEDFDGHGFSYIASYQYVPVWYFKVEGDLELFTELANSSGAVMAPKFFLTVGGLVYGGVGVGVYYHSGDSDNNWGDVPFYILRAGFDIPIMPRLFLDINANYRFNDWDSISWNSQGNPGSDTIRLGATIRYAL